jgi:hypothetical protein
MNPHRAVGLALGAALLGLGAGRAAAEPMFLARQYARCTTCHYSPTGGGLLTPYGRSLSRQEISTTGRSAPAQQEQGTEQDFLFGLLGAKPGPVDVGIELRPAHLNVDFGGQSTSRDFFMTADILAAYRAGGWTLYGELGREPLLPDAKIDSYEYWVAHQSDNGLGFRVGRFMPAFGIHLADHTAFSRADLGFNYYDQVYGLELSYSGQRDLVQVSVSPGRADSIIHDDGRRAFTATGRWQLDLSSRSVLVFSGLFRGAARDVGQNGASGVAFGFAPTSRVSIWSEADARFQTGGAGPQAYTLLNETSVEVLRGLWLKFSPQLRTDFGNTSGGLFRMAFEADLFPRAHWNVDLSYYRDKNRLSSLTTKTLLMQLHLYL